MHSIDAYFASLHDGTRVHPRNQAGDGRGQIAIRLVGVARATRSAALATAVSALVLGGPVVAAPGDLDPAFGSGGRGAVPNDRYYSAWSVELLADGSSVFGGGDDICDYYSNDCFIAGNFGRLLDTGMEDATFAPNFLASTRITDLAVQADQKIVGVAQRIWESGGGLVVFRTLPNGTLDSSFAGGGQQILAGPPGESQLAASVVIDDQQRIVIAGSRGSKLLVVRLLTDGTLDLTFGSGGVFVGAAAETFGSVPRIVTAGGGSYRVMLNADGCHVVALTSAGAVDAAYGVAGSAATDAANAHCSALAVQSDGKLVLGGWSDDAPFVERLLATGAHDSAFNTDAATAKLAFVTALAIGPGGKVLVAGGASDESAPATVMRLQPSGTLDAAYGVEGVAVVDLESIYDSYPTIHDMKVQPNGRLLLAGSGIPYLQWRPFVARLLADGEAGPGLLARTDLVVQTTEQAGQAVVKVRRFGGSHGAVSVAYAALPADFDSATAGSDFTAVTGRLNWADGDTTDKQVTIPIAANTSPLEGEETFFFDLSDPQGGAGIGVKRTFVTIQGDGYPNGMFSAQAGASAVIERGDAHGRFIVRRHNYGTGQVSVTATVMGQTATEGKDFTGPGPVILTWAADDMNDKFVEFDVLGDERHEDGETVTVTLSNPTGGAVIYSGAAPTITITDNDKPNSGGGGGAFGALEALLLGLLGTLKGLRRRW
jgi:uncharacterized delta-60 repeat protein